MHTCTTSITICATSSKLLGGSLPVFVTNECTTNECKCRGACFEPFDNPTQRLWQTSKRVKGIGNFDVFRFGMPFFITVNFLTHTACPPFSTPPPIWGGHGGPYPGNSKGDTKGNLPNPCVANSPYHGPPIRAQTRRPALKLALKVVNSNAANGET